MRLKGKDVNVQMLVNGQPFDVSNFDMQFTVNAEEADAQHVEQVLSELAEDGETDPSRMSASRLADYVKASVGSTLGQFVGGPLALKHVVAAVDATLCKLQRDGNVDGFKVAVSPTLSDTLDVQVRLPLTAHTLCFEVKLQ